ncbi:hypothetical protein EVAR_28947_1 [Eumeta japonica]|uniref:Uncharacterized protein n=1 Tax=Eumeta variegata TaxID=151549 RepID=A0A4C1VZN7_EUMVA|nr:hypothetical protein EVAR_28947_1 [Eumeta japonica]
MSDISVSSQGLSHFPSSNSKNTLKRAVWNFENELPQYLKPKKKVKNIMTQDLAAALDRTEMSNRRASFLISSFVKVLNVGDKNNNSSATSIQRNRIRSTNSIVSHMKENSKSCDQLVLHWDGKLLPDDNDSKKLNHCLLFHQG